MEKPEDHRVALLLGDLRPQRSLRDADHLTYQSAARNRVLDIGVDTDIDGQRRPVGRGAELDADEYVLVVFLPVILRRAGP